jgi:hypothetical protein
VEPEEVSSFEQIAESVGCILASPNSVKVEVVANFAGAIRPSVASFQFLGRPKFNQQQWCLCIVRDVELRISEVSRLFQKLCNSDQICQLTSL